MTLNLSYTSSTSYVIKNVIRRVANLLKKVFFIVIICLSCFQTKAQFPGIELLSGKEKLEVPFEYVQGFITVDVLFQGFLPLKFILDTGAENTLLLKKEITDLLGIQYSKKINLVGSDMSSTVFAYICRNVAIKLNNSATIRQDILVLENDLNDLDQITGMNIDGILGASIFKNLILEIDYRASRIIFYHPEKFKGPRRGFEKYDIEIHRNKPYINCVTKLGDGNEVDVKLLIDSGASLNYLLHENSHPEISLPKYIIPGNIGTGISGNLKGYLGKVAYLQFSDFRFDHVTTSFQNLDESIIESDAYVRNGLVGNRLLDRFTIIIDYPHEDLYLKPRRWHFRKPFQYDKSGLIIYAIGRDFKKFYIKDVIPGTPADEAGILPGDYIVKFNIFPTKFLDLESITNSLSKKAGKKIRLVLLRNGIKVVKEFELEDFLEKNIVTE